MRLLLTILLLFWVAVLANEVGLVDDFLNAIEYNNAGGIAGHH